MLGRLNQSCSVAKHMKVHGQSCYILSKQIDMPRQGAQTRSKQIGNVIYAATLNS